MTPSLSGPPDTDPGAPPRRRRRRRPPPYRSGRLDFEPAPLSIERHQAEDSKVFPVKKRHLPEWGTLVAALVALGTIALVGSLIYKGTRVHVEVKGISDGAALTTVKAASLQVTIVTSSPKVASQAKLSFDGRPVDPTILGATIVWRPSGLVVEGGHRLELDVPRAVLSDAKLHWNFTVDGTPPKLRVAPATKPVALGAPATVTGTVEPGVRLTADGNPVKVGADGRFTLRYDQAPTGPVTLAAVDKAGNATITSVVVPVTFAPLRGVHVTAAAWENDQLRGGILAMADQHRIDAVELDLKDEQGVVGFDTTVAKARQIGALGGNYSLDAAVRTLHDRHVKVIGRIAVFRDPIYARAAWGAGRPDQVIQNADGSLFDATGPYTNPASVAVRDYNLDLATDAVGRGVDDILWDDVRLPNAALDTIKVPRLVGTPSDAVTGFLAEAHSELRMRGAYQGVTVDGASVDLGGAFGQDVGRIARNTDWLAPEIYPGYWGAGRFNVASPIHQPGDLVRGLLASYQKATRGSGVVLMPWLQDFDVGGVNYGDAEVRAQIGAARSLGVRGFMLWTPTVEYNAGALDPAR